MNNDDPGGSKVTHRLNAVAAAAAPDPAASGALFELLYGELRRIAAQKMAGEPSNLTLQPTALVHEAWLRLGGEAQPDWQNRAHFFTAAAEAMRRILTDRARRKLSLRRGSGAEHQPIDEVEIILPMQEDRMLALSEALDRFAASHPEKAELVQLRYFVGLKLEAAAAVLNISVPTATRWWSYARAWLHLEMTRE